MCTLTYLLTNSGYELFFNRDEQRSRLQAITPQMNHSINAIYPIDPLGKGTWIAVHQSGLSFALLNYYQVEKKVITKNFNSRGEIILKLLKLLKHADNALEALKQMSLSDYQAFQLIMLPSDLTFQNNQLRCFQWDGQHLTELQQTLPITSSGVDYPDVYQARTATFKEMVSVNNPTVEQLIDFHQSQQEEGKLSVKMCREDAKTVSFSRISVTDKIKFEYHDYLNGKQAISSMDRY